MVYFQAISNAKKALIVKEGNNPADGEEIEHDLVMEDGHNSPNEESCEEEEEGNGEEEEENNGEEEEDDNGEEEEYDGEEEEDDNGEEDEKPLGTAATRIAGYKSVLKKTEDVIISFLQIAQVNNADELKKILTRYRAYQDGQKKGNCRGEEVDESP